MIYLGIISYAFFFQFKMIYTITTLRFSLLIKKIYQFSKMETVQRNYQKKYTAHTHLNDTKWKWMTKNVFVSCDHAYEMPKPMKRNLYCNWKKKSIEFLINDARVYICMYLCVHCIHLYLLRKNIGRRHTMNIEKKSLNWIHPKMQVKKYMIVFRLHNLLSTNCIYRIAPIIYTYI